MQLSRSLKRWLAKQLAPHLWPELAKTASPERLAALGRPALDPSQLTEAEVAALIDRVAGAPAAMAGLRRALAQEIPHDQVCAELGEGTRLFATASIVNPRNDPGLIRVGEHGHIRGELLAAWVEGRITIGKWLYLGEGSRIWSFAEVTLGDHVLISHNVDIHDTDSHPLDWRERRLDVQGIVKGEYRMPTQTRHAPVVIEDDVWIGARASILKGVRLGRGCIVAAGSVVNRDVAPFTLVAGAPARVIREL